MLFWCKFCLIIVQKLIRAFVRIHPQKYLDAGFTLRPLQPPPLFFATLLLLGGWGVNPQLFSCTNTQSDCVLGSYGCHIQHKYDSH